MTTKTDEAIEITIEFDDAVKALAYLSTLLEFVSGKDVHEKPLRTAKEICEAFCCEHFQKELMEE